MEFSPITLVECMQDGSNRNGCNGGYPYDAMTFSVNPGLLSTSCDPCPGDVKKACFTNGKLGTCPLV